MSKQTAVEWFFDKMKSHFEHDGDLFETACMTYAIAKAKEREQIIDALDVGYQIANEDVKFKHIQTTEQYYNETYGGDK
jgi:hypothetical protein